MGKGPSKLGAPMSKEQFEEQLAKVKRGESLKFFSDTVLRITTGFWVAGKGMDELLARHANPKSPSQLCWWRLRCVDVALLASRGHLDISSRKYWSWGSADTVRTMARTRFEDIKLKMKKEEIAKSDTDLLKVWEILRKKENALDYKEFSSQEVPVCRRVYEQCLNRVYEEWYGYMACDRDDKEKCLASYIWWKGDIFDLVDVHAIGRDSQGNWYSRWGQADITSLCDPDKMDRDTGTYKFTGWFKLDKAHHTAPLTKVRNFGYGYDAGEHRMGMMHGGRLEIGDNDCESDSDNSDDSDSESGKRKKSGVPKDHPVARENRRLKRERRKLRKQVRASEKVVARAKELKQAWLG